MRVRAVIVGTCGEAERQAGMLARFAREGLVGANVTETAAFYADDAERCRLLELAPTRDVRLFRVAARGGDRLAGILAAEARAARTDLYLFAGGAGGTELAARLAARTGGTALTDVLTVELRSGVLVCRRSTFSNHLIASFEPAARPCCVSIDRSWGDGERPVAPEGHVVVSDTDGPPVLGETPLDDVEISVHPTAGDLSGSRFLVVAGSGAGSRAAVERIAVAAAEIGADFGVTRPVVMNGWATMDRLVGVSGVRAAPRLCIVVGASGAPAFAWGVERSGFIVAVNTDPRAPVVEGSDVALLDDGVGVIEELARIIDERHSAV